MFFLLKCAFWLGLVFHAMNWPVAEPAAMAGAVRATAAGAAESAAREAGRACARDIESCLAIARRMEAARSALPHGAATPKAAERLAGRGAQG